jgi:hypothetical protein
LANHPQEEWAKFCLNMVTCDPFLPQNMATFSLSLSLSLQKKKGPGFTFALVFLFLVPHRGK